MTQEASIRGGVALPGLGDSQRNGSKGLGRITPGFPAQGWLLLIDPRSSGGQAWPRVHVGGLPGGGRGGMASTIWGMLR